MKPISWFMELMRPKQTTHHNQNKKERQMAIVNNKIPQKGTVKFYDTGKRFGFITSETGIEYYVHADGLTSRIKGNDEVNFELKKGPRGLQAIRVSSR